MSSEREPDAVAERYARRPVTERYSVSKPDVWQTLQERQRALLALFARIGWDDLASKRLLEVGCGGGANLLELLRLGFAPEHLAGVELLPERHAQARHVLPEAVAVHAGDALQLDTSLFTVAAGLVRCLDRDLIGHRRRRDSLAC